MAGTKSMPNTQYEPDTHTPNSVGCLGSGTPLTTTKLS